VEKKESKERGNKRDERQLNGEINEAHGIETNNQKLTGWGQRDVLKELCCS
jgi:hypothetical protein